MPKSNYLFKKDLQRAKSHIAIQAFKFQFELEDIYQSMYSVTKI